jgi:alpha-glucoside transport system permease protein
MTMRIFGYRITLGALVAHLALFILVAMWTAPTLGLFISSLRDKDQLINSGWWTALSTNQMAERGRLSAPAEFVEENGRFVARGQLLDPKSGKKVIAFSDNINDPGAHPVGVAADVKKGQLRIDVDGAYEFTADEKPAGKRGKRVFYEVDVPPRFSLENYAEVLAAEGVGQSFINTFTVVIPATFIPILVAAFAAYAFSWMEFRGRQILFVLVVGLLVVPLQMSLIPLLRLYNDIGDAMGVGAKTYLGIWLAHTGFGLPMAIYLLRNYIGGLPRDIIEVARIDGATHFEIFTRIVLPLSIPALASFAIFQFLWVWNDLLVALVFLGKSDNQIVLTSKLRELLGSRGDNWEILTASAFVSIAVPLTVFFALQRYFVRGLLAGSVKGG